MTIPPDRTGIFVIGAAKAGTTWLHSLCQRHPELATPSIKETNYFAHRFDRGTSFYEELYSGDSGIRIDNSPAYLPHAKAVTRIHEYNSEARIVVILRNTLDRALSHYEMLYNNGALTGDPRIDLAPESRIVQDSLYGTHLRRWTEAFGPDRLKLLYFSDIREKPEQLWRDFCSFGNVACVPIPEIDKAVNVRRGRPRNLALYRLLVDTVERLSTVKRLARSRPFRGVRHLYHRLVFAQDTAASRNLSPTELRRLAELFRRDLERIPDDLRIPSERLDSLRPAPQ